MKQLNINEMNIVSGAGTNNVSRGSDIKDRTKPNQSGYGSYGSAIANIYEALSNSILNSIHGFFR